MTAETEQDEMNPPAVPIHALPEVPEDPDDDAPDVVAPAPDDDKDDADEDKDDADAPPSTDASRPTLSTLSERITDAVVEQAHLAGVVISRRLHRSMQHAVVYELARANY